MSDSPETTLASLATRFPAASRRFHDLGLDYCCGGQRPLSEACRERGLDPDALLREIEAEEVGSDAPRWDERPLSDLIQHILVRYHDPLREEMPQLIAMAHKVESVHGDKAACPRGLEAVLATMAEGLADHMRKEEEGFFPLLPSGPGLSVGMAVRVLTQEHDDHAFALRRVRELTGGFTPPEEACTTWRALYLRLEELERELMEHVHLENNVLFPRALRAESTGSDTQTEARS